MHLQDFIRIVLLKYWLPSLCYSVITIFSHLQHFLDEVVSLWSRLTVMEMKWLLKSVILMAVLKRKMCSAKWKGRAVKAEMKKVISFRILRYFHFCQTYISFDNNVACFYLWFLIRNCREIWNIFLLWFQLRI